jgi:hypothetical protein
MKEVTTPGTSFRLSRLLLALFLIAVTAVSSWILCRWFTQLSFKGESRIHAYWRIAIDSGNKRPWPQVPVRLVRDDGTIAAWQATPPARPDLVRSEQPHGALTVTRADQVIAELPSDSTVTHQPSVVVFPDLAKFVLTYHFGERAEVTVFAVGTSSVSKVYSEVFSPFEATDPHRVTLRRYSIEASPDGTPVLVRHDALWTSTQPSSTQPAALTVTTDFRGFWDPSTQQFNPQGFAR